MRVEIWSDVVCPWCYIGKRRLEQALVAFEHANDVDLVWRSFQLDPSAPPTSEGDPLDRLAEKYGISRAQAETAQARVTAAAAEAGLEFHLDRARSGNTFDAHRLLHHAGTIGQGGALKERLLAAYFSEGEAIGVHDVLVRLAEQVGLDPDVSRRVLGSDAFTDEVRSDIREARRLGITGVPFFVIDRTYGISGAQPAELLTSALRKAWDSAHPFVMTPASVSDDACTDESCAV